jgi:hypothetical protein
MESAEKLGVDVGTQEEVEALLTQLCQLLVGISIMQVGAAGWEDGAEAVRRASAGIAEAGGSTH